MKKQTVSLKFDGAVLLPSDLTDGLKKTVEIICIHEKRDIKNITFRMVDFTKDIIPQGVIIENASNYLAMLDDNKWTGYGYFIEENEID